MANIRDVAKAAGVSVATVSRVINNDVRVKEVTRNHVITTINKLNYKPNMLGRSLRRCQTNKILVLLNTISNQYYSGVVKGIEKKANEIGFSVMICMTHSDKLIEQQYIEMIKTKLFDGVIFLITENDAVYLNSQLSGVAAVQACEINDDFDTSIVCIDNKRAGYDAVSFLIESGHKKIAFFGAGDDYRSSVERRSGYVIALTENYLELKPEWIIEEGFSYAAGERCAKRLLSCGDLPTAVFAVSDSCAISAMKYLSLNGVKIPEDISFIGFDNTSISKVSTPSLTTVEQPQFEIGYNAMELLAEKIYNLIVNPNAYNKRKKLDYSIIMRESVKICVKKEK